MLYLIEADKPLRETNNSIDAVVEFKGVEDEVLRFCFFLVDYRSPYRMLPKNLRVKSVLTSMGFTTDVKRKNFLNKNTEVIAKVCDKYNELQYSIQHDLLRACKAQIQQWVDLLSDTDKDDRAEDRALKIFNSMDSLLARMRKLEETVGDIKVDVNEKEDWTRLEIVLDE